MENLRDLLEALETKMKDKDKKNVKVSKAPVSWHLQHSLLVIIKITEAVKKSNPADYKWKFNLVKSIVLAIGKFPRGKGEAPATVQPQGEINEETINAALIKAKASLAAYNSLPPDSFFTHPNFGELNIKPTLRFLKIHTKHHLKIIDEIIASR